MDVNELKHAIKHCTENNCIGCMYRDDLQCVNHIMSAADRCIAELEERLAIMQESMEALEKRLAEMEWNLLTENSDGIIHGLPGDDGQYIMTDGKEIWIDDYVDGVTDGIILDSGRDIREIKAWMYMPELPKTDGE